jgi:septum formation protein
MTKLYLASRSPRRRELLARLTDDFDLLDVETDEAPGEDEKPADYVSRLSLEKAGKGMALLQVKKPVLGADTEVVLDGRVFGKPSNFDEAVAMLFELSGREHRVYTAVTLVTDRIDTVLSVSTVRFRRLDRLECEDYCNQCMPLDKAGAYGIQDLAAAYIDRFEGSYTGVMGLPMEETRKLLVGAKVIP